MRLLHPTGRDSQWHTEIATYLRRSL
jgi:hypothetical protein